MLTHSPNYNRFPYPLLPLCPPLPSLKLLKEMREWKGYEI